MADLKPTSTGKLGSEKNIDFYKICTENSEFPSAVAFNQLNEAVSLVHIIIYKMTY